MKSDPKTMRFDEDVYGFIENWEGSNFSDKFHNMVRFFIVEEKLRKEKLLKLEDDIRARQGRIMELSAVFTNFSDLERKYSLMLSSIDSCTLAFDRISSVK